MSFSFKIVAANLAAALVLLDAQRANTNNPVAVLDFVEAGIKGLEGSLDSAPVIVEVDGHLCTGRGSYEVTSAKISITPLYLTPMPAPKIETAPEPVRAAGADPEPGVEGIAGAAATDTIAGA